MHKIKAGLGVVGALALALLPTVSANADVQAQPGEIVGVGSDTVQYLSDFIADGDYTGGAGYNATHLNSRIVNYDATGDAFGALTTGAGSVLRAGQKPSIRPDGSGTGYDAINADANDSIQYVRASSTPNAARISAANTAFGGYHAYRVTTDSVFIAVSGANSAVGTSEVPANLSAAELTAIYSANPATAGDLTTCPTFSSLIGRGPNSVIKPVIPQAGSGTRNSFLAAINVTNPGGCTVTVQEHDPVAIGGVTGTTSPTASIDTLGPFSNGRFSLINGGYFSAKGINSGIVALQTVGVPANRPLYIVLRQNDLTDSSGNQIGSVSNAQIQAALFANVTGAYTKSASTRLFTNSGFTRSFLDCEASGAAANTFC